MLRTELTSDSEPNGVLSFKNGNTIKFSTSWATSCVSSNVYEEIPNVYEEIRMYTRNYREHSQGNWVPGWSPAEKNVCGPLNCFLCRIPTHACASRVSVFRGLGPGTAGDWENFSPRWPGHSPVVYAQERVIHGIHDGEVKPSCISVTKHFIPWMYKS